MKKYINIKDKQGGEFAMYRCYTAEEWGKQAYEWADSDGWEHPENCLLSSFAKEEDLINFINDMWDIEIVEERKDNEELIKYLKELYLKEFIECNSDWVIEWAKSILKELEE